MGYDVDRKPATWVMTQSLRRERLLIGTAAATILIAVGVILATVAGYRVSGAVSIGLLALVIGARPYANRYADRHFRMFDGALAEEAVGETLNELRRERWIVMHDVEQRYEGNIDHLVSGPNGVYLVETKLRRYETRDLVKAMRQAMKIHDELSGFVTPVICLHTRAGHAFKARGVWIVPHHELLDWLRAQRNRAVPFERLALYAEKT